MSYRLWLVLPLALVSVLPANLLAQTINNDFQQSGLYYGVQQLRVVAGKVYTTKGDPIPRARIEITNNAGAALQSTVTDPQGAFYTQYDFLTDSDEVKHFTVSLKVTKKGFQEAHRRVEISATKIVGIAITLRPIQSEDPNVLSQAELIKLIAPRLRQLPPADEMVAKDQKEYARGVQEFLDRNRLEQAIAHLAIVAKNNPTCLRCRTMLGLAELSWGDWDDAQTDISEPVNAYIADKKLGCFEPLFVQGELSSELGDPERASAYLAEAAKFAPKDPLALRELARAQSQDLEWLAASETLKKALAVGAGPDVQLMLAEALSWAGTPDEAEVALNTYLNGRELKTMPPRVKSVWANIQAKQKDEAAFLASNTKAKARGKAVELVDYINNPPVASLVDFVPVTDQTPLDAIVEAVGKKVSELFADLPNLCSMEHVHQERLTRKGTTASAQEYKYRYLMTTGEQRWGPSVDEHRANLRGHETAQLGSSEFYMLTSGFVSAPLIFHPAYRAGSIFRLLGHQKLNGRDTFVISYAQQPKKSRICGSFQRGMNTSLTYSQGMAWIDSENYQIIRLKTDLLRPAPLVRLNKENTEIEFSEVQFKKQNLKFWLPNNVMVTLEWDGRVFRNSHTYSDFLVSNVDSSQKIGKPKDAEAIPTVDTPEATPSVPAANSSRSFVPAPPKL